MSKLFTVFCVALALSTVSAQTTTCASTAALRSVYGLSNSMTTAVASDNVQYCKSIKTEALCCSADQINAFQTNVDTMSGVLSSSVATRDLAYQAVGNGNSQEALTSAVTNLQNSITSMSNQIFGELGSTGLAGISSSTMSGILQSAIYTSLGFNPANLTTALASVYDNVTANLGTFQQARTNCALEMMKTQASAWCLSCDPNAGSKGYNMTTHTLTMSNEVCNRLKSSCFDFVSSSNLQNTALSVEPLVSFMQGASSLLSGINQANYATAFTSFNSSSYYAQAPQVSIGTLPPGCSNASTCDWICTDLFKNGNLSSANFLSGGVPQTSPSSVSGTLSNLGVSVPTYDGDLSSLISGFTSGLTGDTGDLSGLTGNLGDLSGLTGSLGSGENSVRLLQELTIKVAPADDDNVELSTLRPSSRRLYNAGTSNTFNPDEDEAGVAVTFSNDPAHVDSSSKSAMRYYGSVLTVVTIAVCSIML